MSSIRQYLRIVTDRLTPALDDAGEARDAAYIIFEDVAGYSRNFIFAEGDRELTDFMQGKIDAVVNKIISGTPVQYAVGTARFMGNDYSVNPSVLIPRPETAALVDMISDDFSSTPDTRVLDIGTGSGCIAISIAKTLPFAQVEAWDISDHALATARENALKLKAKVSFIKQDALTAKAPGQACYDIIVSNPPYICQSEEKDMDPRVYACEPSQALFVPDSDPLVFYRAIAAYAAKALKPGGKLYFEINSRFPDEIKELLEQNGFENISVTRDFKGNYRYAVASQK